MTYFLSRAEVTNFILNQKVQNNLKWNDLSCKLSCNPVWGTAACLGQMKFSASEAETVGKFFNISKSGVKWLQQVPNERATAIPSDPLIYRMYEALGVYGPAIKELIHEDLGYGIMSAIDFDITLDTKSVEDRVVMTWSGKFLPYKRF